MNSLLEEAIEAWDGARRGVIAEASGIPARDWDFRPAPGARSVDELAGHIVATAMMWTNELTRPTADFTRKSFPAFIRHYAKGVEKPRPRAEWLRLLRSSFRDGARQLRAAGEVQMLQYVRRFDGEHGTRLTWLHHGIAHEEYHRAQLALLRPVARPHPGPHAGDRGRERGIGGAGTRGPCAARRPRAQSGVPGRLPRTRTKDGEWRAATAARPPPARRRGRPRECPPSSSCPRGTRTP